MGNPLQRNFLGKLSAQAVAFDVSFYLLENFLWSIIPKPFTLFEANTISLMFQGSKYTLLFVRL